MSPVRRALTTFGMLAAGLAVIVAGTAIHRWYAERPTEKELEACALIDSIAAGIEIKEWPEIEIVMEESKLKRLGERLDQSMTEPSEGPWTELARSQGMELRQIHPLSSFAEAAAAGSEALQQEARGAMNFFRAVSFCEGRNIELENIATVRRGGSVGY